MTLLRDVITIPEQVRAGDYVLKLTEGVERLDETLGEYVVTPALARAFDAALGLVEVAVTSGRSQASASPRSRSVSRGASRSPSSAWRSPAPPTR